MIRQYIYSLIFTLVFVTNVKSQGCTFDIAYTGFASSTSTAFSYAANQWTYYLTSTVPIKINAVYFTFAGGPLAITFSNGRKDFAGAPLDSTWYPTSLANSITSTELNIGEVDMDIYLNGAFSWYEGTDGLTPVGQYDLVSVIMHEIGHGLGFTSLAKKESSTGSFGLLQMSDFAPVVTSFPWPDLDTLPGIYDRFLENNPGTDLLTYTNPSTTLGGQFTSNNIYFNGPNTIAANAGNRARIHAPSTFTLGTSILHLNEGTYPVGNDDELMTPYVTAGVANHYVGAMTLAMLKDIGWIEYIGINEFENEKDWCKIWPNPANNHIRILQMPTGLKEIVLTDVSGKFIKKISTNEAQIELLTTEIPIGFYCISISSQAKIISKKLIVSR